MAMQFSAFSETPEERAQRLRQATIRRTRILIVICGIAIAARLYIKNPPPPKAQDMATANIRYTPGMLEKMSASSMAKMDPILLARLQKADAEYRTKQLREADTFVKGAYHALDAPFENKAQEEADKQIEFVYAKRKQIQLAERKKIREAQDLSKTMLVQFRTGGYLKAESASQEKKICEIRVDHTILARLPNQMVKSVSNDALTWKEPVPKGFVQLKPATGITITLEKETAKRITIKKYSYDEI